MKNLLTLAAALPMLFVIALPTINPASFADEEGNALSKAIERVHTSLEEHSRSPYFSALEVKRLLAIEGGVLRNAEVMDDLFGVSAEMSKRYPFTDWESIYIQIATDGPSDVSLRIVAEEKLRESKSADRKGQWSVSFVCATDALKAATAVGDSAIVGEAAYLAATSSKMKKDVRAVIRYSSICALASRRVAYFDQEYISECRLRDALIELSSYNAALVVARRVVQLHRDRFIPDFASRIVDDQSVIDGLEARFKSTPEGE